ncbi:trigger factor [Candidatus Parcubacteria bacterium]|nr:MAG: trigger factor [Candidatus Parcubacteria bacterium]
MRYTIEHKKPTELTAVLTAPYAEIEPLLPAAAAAIGNELEIEGFRKGKAPATVIRARVGEAKILEEAAGRWLQAHMPDLLKEIETQEFPGTSLDPIDAPAATITRLAPGQDVEFRVVVLHLPPIRLPDYRAIAAKVLATQNIPVVTDAEIEQAQQWLRESRAKLVTVDRPAAKGDRVEIDFSTRADGVAIESGESKNHPLVLGESRMPPGFDDELIGLRAGDEKSFTLVIPQEFPSSSIAGKRLEFTTRMNLVQKRELPAWDETFARSLGKFSGAAEVTNSIREGLVAEKTEKERERLRIAMAEAIAKDTKADIPEPLIERELEKMLGELGRTADRMGVPLDQYLAHLKKSIDELKRDWRDDARRRVLFALVLREIARREHIEPTEEDVIAAVNRTVAHEGMNEDDLKTIDREAFVAYHRGIARNEKVFAFLESLGPRASA